MSDSKICQHCQTQNDSDAAFCINKNCGKMFDATQDSQQQPLQQSQVPKQPPPPQVTQEPQQSPPQQEPQHSNRGFVFIVGLVALTAVIIAALYFIPPLLSHENNQDTLEAIINPNVVIYDPESSPFEILESDFYSVTVSTLEGIDTTTILASGVSEETPYGLLRIIDSVEEVDGAYKINTAPAALSDAIEQCDISFTVEFDYYGNYEIIEDAPDQAGLFEIPQAFASSLNHNLFSRTEDFGVLSAGISLDVSLRIHRGNVDMSLVLRCYAGAQISLDTAFQRNQTLTRFHKPLTFFIGPLPVVLDNRIHVDAEFSAQASALAMDVDIALDKAFGFEYSTQRGLRAINRDNSRWPQSIINPEQEIFSASLSAELGITFGTRLYGLAGPDMRAAVNGEASAELRRLPDGVESADAIRLPRLDWLLSGSYRERVTVPISGRFILEIPDFNPFSRRSTIQIANVELFNTRDAITLLDVSLEFGHPEREQGDDQASQSQGNIRTFILAGPEFNVSFEYNADLFEEEGYADWFVNDDKVTGFNFIARNNSGITYPRISVSIQILRESLADELGFRTDFARGHGEITSEYVGPSYIAAEGIIHAIGTGLDTPSGYMVINEAFRSKYLFSRSTEDWLLGVTISFPDADRNIWDAEAERIINSLRVTPASR